MYLPDPEQLMLKPRILEGELDVDEEPRDYHEFFWDEAVERGRQIGPSQRLHTQVCRFDQNGIHITMAAGCPHFEMEDETGRNIQRGWTAQ